MRCGRRGPTSRRCRWPGRWTCSRPSATPGPGTRSSSTRSWRCCGTRATEPSGARRMSDRSGSLKHLQILHTVAGTVSRSLDVDEVLRIALDALTDVTGHEISSLHLVSADGATLRLRGDRGL